MASKIAEFEDLLGKLSDGKIAEMADVKADTVARYRKSKGIAEFVADGEQPPEPEDKGQEADEEPDGPAAADVAAFIVYLKAQGYTVLKPGEAPKAKKPTRQGPPSCVKATKTTRLTRPGSGRRWRVGYGDIFTGEEARHLWEHHRDIVTPYGE